ncbi:Fic family protein [Deferribacterales bacterium RsTz2092]|nr:cell division protein Fic [Deferribacterales bacterium]
MYIKGSLAKTTLLLSPTNYFIVSNMTNYEVNTNIEQQRKTLTGLLKKTDNEKVLLRWLTTELAYTSNAIEGNTLTRRETALAIEENIVAGAKPLTDYIEARNHADAFRFIFDARKQPITKNLVLTIHRLILQGIDNLNAGVYRSVRVRISGSRVVLPNPLKVPDLMEDFVQNINTDMPTGAIEAHLALVSIHPFIDGNGRTARLLMNLMLINAGYAPIIIRPRDRKRYIACIEKAQMHGDNNHYILFMLRALERSQQTAIDLLTKDVPDTKKLLKIGELARLAGLPVSTLRFYIASGKLTLASRTESDYMLFDPKQAEELKENGGAPAPS